MVRQEARGTLRAGQSLLHIYNCDDMQFIASSMLASGKATLETRSEVQSCEENGINRRPFRHGKPAALRRQVLCEARASNRAPNDVKYEAKHGAHDVASAPEDMCEKSRAEQSCEETGIDRRPLHLCKPAAPQRQVQCEARASNRATSDVTDEAKHGAHDDRWELESWEKSAGEVMEKSAGEVMKPFAGVEKAAGEVMEKSAGEAMNEDKPQESMAEPLNKSTSEAPDVTVAEMMAMIIAAQERNDQNELKGKQAQARVEEVERALQDALAHNGKLKAMNLRLVEQVAEMERRMTKLEHR